jgi:hypothetical protein
VEAGMLMAMGVQNQHHQKLKVVVRQRRLRKQPNAVKKLPVHAQQHPDLMNSVVLHQ